MIFIRNQAMFSGICIQCLNAITDKAIRVLTSVCLVALLDVGVPMPVNAAPPQDELELLESADFIETTCDECRQVAREAFQRCQRASSGSIRHTLCVKAIKPNLKDCLDLCIETPKEVACPAERVQHWNKILFTTPSNIKIERDGNISLALDTVNEVIVQTEAYEVLWPFEFVADVIAKRPFAVVVLDENNLEIERRNSLIDTDIKIVEVEYSTICAKPKPILLDLPITHPPTN